MAKIQINDEVRDMTAAEEAQYAADIEARNVQVAQLQARQDLKDSAKAKLIAGDPLTADEADLIINNT